MTIEPRFTELVSVAVSKEAGDIMLQMRADDGRLFNLKVARDIAPQVSAEMMANITLTEEQFGLGDLPNLLAPTRSGLLLLAGSLPALEIVTACEARLTVPLSRASIEGIRAVLAQAEPFLDPQGQRH